MRLAGITGAFLLLASLTSQAAQPSSLDINVEPLDIIDLKRPHVPDIYA